MTITKKPTKPAAADAFIAGAPDAPPLAAAPAKARKGVQKGRKEQISLTIATPVLDRVDAAAGELGLTRAGFINMAISRALAGESK